jgi:hypothetical protein
MPVWIRRPGLEDADLCALDSGPSTTVQQLKDSLPGTLLCDVSRETAQLVYGGSVLESTSRISEFTYEETPTLWLLPGSVHDSDQFLLSTIAPLGIFPFGHLELSAMQTCDLPGTVSLLRGFAASLSANSAQWKPSVAEQSALCTAISALESTAPAFGAVPHVTWFGEYGCCLLASVPRVGIVQLRLVCLDEWSFRMHAEAHVRTHTADAGGDAYVLDHVGQVALCDYHDFL